VTASNNNETRRRAGLQREEAGGEKIKPMVADDHTTSHPAVETPVEARQGFLGRPVLMVLIGGLALAGVAWLVVHYAVP
jgi:hypothetical protein